MTKPYLETVEQQDGSCETRVYDYLGSVLEVRGSDDYEAAKDVESELLEKYGLSIPSPENEKDRNLNHKIQRVAITGYRSFAESVDIHFALPDGRPGSGLTVFVGENNTGKSTILESLSFLDTPYQFDIPKEFRNVRTEFQLEIEYEKATTQVLTFKRVRGGGLNLHGFGDRTEGGEDLASKMYPTFRDIFFIPSRRTPGVDLQESDFQKNTGKYHRQYDERRGKYPNDAINRRLVDWPDDVNRINGLLERLYGDRFKLRIDSSGDKTYSVRVHVDGVDHHITQGGEGVSSMVHIIDALRDDTNAMIVIDEPEISISPPVQKRLYELLKEASRHRQIILSTHSPHFIDIEALESGAVINRVFKKDGSTNVSNLSFESNQYLKSVNSNWRNPHVFGYDAKQVFFMEDNIVVCEGQHDVGLFSKAINELEIPFKGTFYGWGAGGVDTIPHILSMLKAMSYERVVALTDSLSDERREKIQAISSKFKLIEISSDDIMDKTHPREIEGLFSSGGDLKDESSEEIHRIFTEINEYFSGK